MAPSSLEIRQVYLHRSSLGASVHHLHTAARISQPEFLGGRHVVALPGAMVPLHVLTNMADTTIAHRLTRHRHTIHPFRMRRPQLRRRGAHNRNAIRPVAAGHRQPLNRPMEVLNSHGHQTLTRLVHTLNMATSYTHLKIKVNTTLTTHVSPRLLISSSFF